LSAAAPGQWARVRREPEVSEHEAAGQLGGDGTGGIPEDPPHRVEAGPAVEVGQTHAARVVEQDAEHVALRHGAGQQQHRPEQTESQQRENGHPEEPENQPILER
jgi:hypothetical protein